jgi:hypothetical protein
MRRGQRNPRSQIDYQIFAAHVNIFGHIQSIRCFSMQVDTLIHKTPTFLDNGCPSQVMPTSSTPANAFQPLSMHYNTGQHSKMFPALFKLSEHICRLLSLFNINRRMSARVNMSLDFVALFKLCQHIHNIAMIVNVSRCLATFVNAS